MKIQSNFKKIFSGLLPEYQMEVGQDLFHNLKEEI